MAIAGLQGLLSNQQSRVQIIAGSNTVITLDCSLREKHSRKSPPTEFEIENGQSISDHIIVKPFMLTLNGIVTDTPLNLISGLKTAALFAAGSLIAKQAVKNTPSLGVIKNAAPALALLPALASTSSPSKSIYDQISLIQSSAQPVSVLTSLHRYQNMWISDISFPRDSETGKGLIFDIEFTQLLLVSPKSVNITKYASPNTAAAQANKGKLPPNPLVEKAQAGFSAGQNVLGLPK